MRLRSLVLENFRNYEKLEFAFPEAKKESNILIISGKNGEGKTNLLEAMYLLALTKSFRNRRSESMIQWEKDFFRVTAEVEKMAEDSAKNDSSIKLEQCLVQHPKKQKAFKKNDVIIPREHFIGHLRAVLFRPEDLAMLVGEPSLRRQYLNNIFIQTDPSGITTLQNYQHALAQRNALLQNGNFASGNNSTLDLWNDRLAAEGEKIQSAREKFIQFLQNMLATSDASGLQFEISYSASRPLKTALEKNLKKDLAFGVTTVGPHREDLKITFNGHPIAESASRGQLRHLILSFKKAERDWIQLQTGQNPILLFDDLFSELDSEGKEDILKLIPASQTIMTVAEGNPLPALKGEATVRKIHDAQIQG